MPEVRNFEELQSELDLKNQALYDCERQKKTVEALLLECQEEIRILQTDKTEENKKLEAKIQQLEDTLANQKVTSNEQISCLEKEIASKDEEIADLKRKLEDFCKLSRDEQPVEDHKLFEENVNLKEQIEELLNQVEDLTHICESKEDEITSLHEINTQLKEELENHKEILNCKKDELREANGINQELQDKYSCLQAEFEALKSKPLDEKSQGNSLFAEVDDRRVQLQQNINTMKTQFMEMKKQRVRDFKQMAFLRNENANLLVRMESQAKEQENDDEMILQTYKNQIHTLNELIESYKKELKQNAKKSDGSTLGSLSFFEKMLNAKNEENEELRQKLSRQSCNEHILSHDLANARRDIRTHKLEILKLQNEIGQLKNDIEELKLPKLQDLQEIPVVEAVEKMEIVDLVDETDKEDKKVQFTEDTIEPRVTDRARYKRGGKILHSKPVFISTRPKKDK